MGKLRELAFIEDAGSALELAQVERGRGHEFFGVRIRREIDLESAIQSKPIDDLGLKLAPNVRLRLKHRDLDVLTLQCSSRRESGQASPNNQNSSCHHHIMMEMQATICSVMDEGHIGVDESGKGDFFGPLVVAACFVGPEHLAELDGVMDSKKLTDKKALALARVIEKTCPHTVLIVGPKRYNEIYADIKNLNRLLEWGHAKVIEETLKKAPCDLVISDQFADPRGLKRKLELKGLKVNLRSEVRAEADIAVAAASILARAGFLRMMERLSGEFGMEIPKGASAAVITAGKRFVANHGRDRLHEVAKMHFKTAQQVLS